MGCLLVLRSSRASVVVTQSLLFCGTLSAVLALMRIETQLSDVICNSKTGENWGVNVSTYNRSFRLPKTWKNQSKNHQL